MTHPEYQFKSIGHYDLYITEDDGEMDKDFPPLDTKECVNKFKFNCLSLVEHKNKKIVIEEPPPKPSMNDNGKPPGINNQM